MNARIYFSLQALASATSAMALICPAQPAKADVLTVVAQGRIDPACGITVETPLASADFTTTGFVRGTALINCNTGFAIKATSANGALRNSAAVSRGFTNSLAYKLTLTVALSGAPSIKGVCGSATLVAGQSTCAFSPAGPGLSSGGFASFQRAALYFSWKTPAKPRLVAGSYQDTITISIAAAP